MLYIQYGMPNEVQEYSTILYDYKHFSLGSLFSYFSHLNHVLFAEFVLRSPFKVIASNHIIYKPNSST